MLPSGLKVQQGRLHMHSSLSCGYRPASWRLRPHLDQNEAHALQVLNVLLEEGAGNLQQPGLFLQPAGQHVG